MCFVHYIETWNFCIIIFLKLIFFKTEDLAQSLMWRCFREFGRSGVFVKNIMLKEGHWDRWVWVCEWWFGKIYRVFVRIFSCYLLIISITVCKHLRIWRGFLYSLQSKSCVVACVCLWNILWVWWRIRCVHNVLLRFYLIVTRIYKFCGIWPVCILVTSRWVWRVHFFFLLPTLHPHLF